MRKIIIADDEHKILMSLEYGFKKNGYDVYIARDGTEVLDFLKTMVPDVILLDIMMPNLDGYSTLDMIRQD
ncbi:response regulator transcription factor, partial [Chryseobacterium sp. SIMBA_029]|uniref:response regulator transcription factor n=1 Tax=Chryseobacterium sp. SIMBA_029 TaxID=3085772 RepID=UPI00397DEC61